jgi:hypothetical protein
MPNTDGIDATKRLLASRSDQRVAEVLLVLGGDDATLGGLLDRQADAATLEVRDR